MTPSVGDDVNNLKGQKEEPLTAKSAKNGRKVREEIQIL